MDCWRPASYLEEEPIAPVWIVGGQLQGTRQDLLGVARVALLLVHPAHTGVEKEWSRNDFSSDPDPTFQIIWNPHLEPNPVSFLNFFMIFLTSILFLKLRRDISFCKMLTKFIFLISSFLGGY
jgi:hypothetical protein